MLTYETYDASWNDYDCWSESASQKKVMDFVCQIDVQSIFKQIEGGIKIKILNILYMHQVLVLGLTINNLTFYKGITLVLICSLFPVPLIEVPLNFLIE